MQEMMGDGPNLYEFLLEAELAQYYNALKNDLKVASVSQLKYVEEDDLTHVGMSKPEQRRLRKFFQKYFPQTYLMKIKKMILPKTKEDSDRTSILSMDCAVEKNLVRVPSKHIISAESIVINKELGVGEFGVVQQGVWTNEDGDRIQVAIKCLSKERMQNNYMEFLKEAVIMHSIDHDHIVRLYGVVLDTSALMLVTELAPLRSLLECLKEPALRPSFPVISLCDFALQICDGMQYLESKRLIHRDLAARNILVFAKNKVKISDFGLSRALGVGKDYYQTNFNVNLKLPIAWCAPECINYLRFTSASDVWAYAVTLWEMFSYGFQPWAALTGQQILEATDEPNFQRLEQPECCPKEYYTLMLRCWQHDPNKRPNFSDILYILPECKPEQVQAVKDFSEIQVVSRPKKELLVYCVGDVITVLDKRPLSESPQMWKGVLLSGKTGLFSPANTVAYLGQNLPTNRPIFCRDGKTSTMYASRRRLRPDMISGPQGDLKHTGHVGLDGAFFGDISFLGDKYQQLPKQIVTPYKPHEDREQSSLMRASSDLSDKAPLLSKSNSMVDGKSGPACESWSVTFSDNMKSCMGNAMNGSFQKPKTNGKLGHGADHEYHEISDDEEEFAASDSPPFESLDFGPSLMDEVFKALSSHNKMDFDLDEQQSNESNNVKNEIKEITSRALGKDGGSKKKQTTVKPISAADQQTLDSAIAMAKEIANRSMLDLDYRSESDTAQNSPKTPNSPTKRKFSFKFKTSPKQERRNFSEEAESIPDFQDTLSEEAKEAYNSLVEKGQGLERANTISSTSGLNHQNGSGPVSPSHFRSSLRTFKPSLANVESSELDGDTLDSNPLRLLRSNGPVRPKIRGNKHGIPSSGRATTPHTATVARLAANASALTLSGTSSLGRAGLGTPPPPPSTSKVSENDFLDQANCVDFESRSPSDEKLIQEPVDLVLDSSSNPLPLPPRDRSKPLPVLKQHQRKYPLVLPGSSVGSDSLPKRPLAKQVSCPEVPHHSPPSPLSWKRGTSLSESDTSCLSEIAQEANIGSSSLTPSEECLKLTKPKSSSLDDSFETRIQAEIDSLDDIPEEVAPSPPLCKKTDHVSCEDLLEFAMDKPNAKRTQGRARGTDSDEVRIMQKVLVKEQLSPEECLLALNETDWDVHNAIKYIRLLSILKRHSVVTENAKQTLMSCNWDVQQAANYLLATHNVPDNTTEV